jgi:hypothetical protein
MTWTLSHCGGRLEGRKHETLVSGFLALLVPHSTVPASREGIEKYLGSGMVKGMGLVYSKRLVE